MFSRGFRRSTIPPARSAGRLVKPNVTEPAAEEIFHEKPKFLFAIFSLALFDHFQKIDCSQQILLPPLGEKTRPAILFWKKNVLDERLETKVVL